MLLPWIFALGSLSLATDVTVQRIVADPAAQEVASGQVATLTITYDSADATLAGVGVRVHYDSSKLALESADLLHSPGLLGREDQPDSGTAYLDRYDDGDPATDRRYIASWYGLGSDWPGEDVALPLELLRLRFRTLGVYASTELELTGETCAGCILELSPVEIRATGGGAETAPASTPTPTTIRTPVATATATPSTTPTSGPPPPAGPAGPEPGFEPAIEGIPTLSGLGTLLLVATLAGSALALLFRQRR